MVVSVHLESFQGFFLAEMGREFLMEFYSSLLLDASCIAFVAELNGGAVGFVVGTRRPAHLYRRILLKSGWRFLSAGLESVLKSPRMALRLLRRVFAAQQASYDQREALLMSIAVLPSMQGRGVGRQLVNAFTDAAKQRGASSVSLTTDRLKNAAVNRFYVRFGFRRRCTLMTEEGREMNEYWLALA
jgi:ribosomal protein S18 acetylase RimI-like enzyme